MPVARLIDEMSKLPGIGPKTASRLAFHLLRTSREEALALAEAIIEVKDRIRLCSVCFNITEEDPCSICRDVTRSNAICVVEEPLDVVALERTGHSVDAITYSTERFHRLKALDPKSSKSRS